MPCQGPYGGADYGPNWEHNYLEAERRLCEARWLILRLSGSQNVPTELRTLVAKHTAEQLKHRQGDKKHVLDAITSTLRRLKEDEGRIRNYGGEPGQALLAQRERLHLEFQRIVALTDDELLAEYWGTETRLTSDVVDHV